MGFENYKAETSADSNIAVGEFQKILKLTPWFALLLNKRESRSGRLVGAKKYLNPLCIEKQAMAFTSLWEVLGGDIVNLF